MLTFRPLFGAVVLVAVSAPSFAGQPYNPYATPEEAPPPVSADGTIQWGVFFKSPKIQQGYERLWALGACRNTNRAILEPVKNNKLIIDRLPEAEYTGVVEGAVGTIAGGIIAFQQAPAAGSESLVAQLHPAGVSRLSVTGRVPGSILRPGHVIRFMAEVDEKGRGKEPVKAFDIVTPPADYKPDPVRPETRGEIVAAVKSITGDIVILHVPAGKVRKLTFEFAAEAIATLDAAQVDLIAPGDTITLKGRIWTGEGSMGAGTVFASEVSVTKPALPGEVAVTARP
jgi:hypothetical protein